MADLNDYLIDPLVFKYTDGYVAIPEGPGLGIEINEEAVRQAAEKGYDWKNPVWRNQDGSVAEWWLVRKVVWRASASRRL